MHHCAILILLFKSVCCFFIRRLQKIIKDLNRQLQSQGTGPWPANRVGSLERSLGELSRILESKVRPVARVIRILLSTV